MTDRITFHQTNITFNNHFIEKLAENPDDVAGWERLVRAYGVLGETDKAVAAQAQLDALRAKQNQ